MKYLLTVPAVLLVLLIAVPGPADAGGCGIIRRPVSYGNYYVPVAAVKKEVITTSYLAGVPTPYLVPSREFQFVYAPAMAGVYQTTAPVAAPTVAPAAAAKACVGQCGVSCSCGQACTCSHEKAGAKTDAKATLDQAIRATLEEILREKALAAEEDTPTAHENDTDPTPPAAEATAPAPQPSLDARVAAALQPKCMKCHRAGDRVEGNTVLFDLQGRFNPSVARDLIWEAIRTGHMPPAAGGNPDSPAGLTAGDRELVRQWSSSQ